MWPLLGVAVIALAFALRVNPLIAIALAALASGWAVHLSPFDVLAALGRAFNENRYVSVVFLVLPVIGLLEKYGLQERARAMIGGVRAATAGRLLLGYLFLRQISSALGLTALGGHAQMVRPLIAPMAEAAAEQTAGSLSAPVRAGVRAMAAATDNIGLFFGEDIFIAIGSILLIRGFLASSGVNVQPLDLSLWAIPTAICAFLIHGVRLLLFDGKLARDARSSDAQGDAP
jgi:uncharacterized membrane protein